MADRAAATSYKPRTYAAVKVLPPAQRHLVSRFSYGVTPALATQVRKRRGAAKWFTWQLKGAAIKDPTHATTKAWWPDLARSPESLWKRSSDGVRGGWEVMADYQRWVITRRRQSKQQVLETMTQFWENHLYVPTNGEQWFVHRVSYGETIRKHALGRFDNLLYSAITHPAMLLYLDNATSTAAKPNENLGRELLELHTVGRGRFTEADVKDSARILTGWYVDMWKTWKPSYRPDMHATGRVKVKGFSHANSKADGREVTRLYLRYLARHPDTARRIATKLVTKFVGDAPAPALVDKLAKVYLKNNTAIAPVLQTLIASKQFKAAAGKKVRDPIEDVVATYRALGVKVARPTTSNSAANAVLWQAQSVGATPFGWPRPDGTPIDNASWSSTSRVIASLSMHYSMSGGWWPKERATFRTARAWVPKSGMRFDELVDHLSRSLLHRPSTARLLQACCEATGLRPSDRITHDHGLVKWEMPRLLTCVLDSPDFFRR